METLTTHCRPLLDLPATWAVEDVNLSLADQFIPVCLRFMGNKVIAQYVAIRKPDNRDGGILIPCSLRPESLPAFHGVSVLSAVSRQ